MEVSRSCFYAWKKGHTYQRSTQSNTMEGQVIDVFRQNKRRYGCQRIVAELRNQGLELSHYKARKLMARNGLKAIQPKSFVPKTTNSRHPYRISPNLLRDRPSPAGINEGWVGDITYIPMTDGSYCYLSVWMDLYSRRIVGWDLQDHMRESLVIASFRKASKARKIIAGMIAHSDRGG